MRKMRITHRIGRLEDAVPSPPAYAVEEEAEDEGLGEEGDAVGEAEDGEGDECEEVVVQSEGVAGDDREDDEDGDEGDVSDRV